MESQRLAEIGVIGGSGFYDLAKTLVVYQNGLGRC